MLLVQDGIMSFVRLANDVENCDDDREHATTKRARRRRRIPAHSVPRAHVKANADHRLTVTLVRRTARDNDGDSDEHRDGLAGAVNSRTVR